MKHALAVLAVALLAAPSAGAIIAAPVALRRIGGTQAVLRRPRPAVAANVQMGPGLAQLAGLAWMAGLAGLVWLAGLAWPGWPGQASLAGLAWLAWLVQKKVGASTFPLPCLINSSF